MANELHGGGKFVLTNQTAPTASITAPTPFMGSMMDQPTVVPLLPGVCFDARAKGRHALGTRVSGVQGTIDLLIQTAATGAARTVCYLTDNAVSPTNYLAVKVDSSNRPRVAFTNQLGTVVGQVTPSYAAIAANQPVSIRFAWSSLAAINGLFFASLRVNGLLIAEGDWSTDPLATWLPFKPTHLVLVGPNIGDADFNGTVLACQVSDEVTV